MFMPMRPTLATRTPATPAARLPMIIKGSSEDGQSLYMRTDSGSAQPQRNPTESTAPRAAHATVYVAPYPHCAHSEELVMLANEKHVQLRIHDITEEGRPAWLRGTPSIVVGKLMYCGDAAFQWVLAAAQKETPRAPVQGHIQQQQQQQQQPEVEQLQAVLSVDGKEKGAALGAVSEDYSYIDASDQKYTVNANKALEDMLAARPDLRGNHKRT